MAISATISLQKNREGFCSFGYLLPAYDLILFFCQPCEMVGLSGYILRVEELSQ